MPESESLRQRCLLFDLILLNRAYGSDLAAGIRVLATAEGLMATIVGLLAGNDGSKAIAALEDEDNGGEQQRE